MTYVGLNSATGGAIAYLGHIHQSNRDILTTPVGTRVMRRRSLLRTLYNVMARSLSITRTLFFRDGKARRIEFSVRLTRVDGQADDVIGSGMLDTLSRAASSL